MDLVPQSLLHLRFVVQIVTSSEDMLQLVSDSKCISVLDPSSKLTTLGLHDKEMLVHRITIFSCCNIS